MKEDVVHRLITLKYSLKEAEKYLSQTEDAYAFSIGMSLMHDVIENLFWAIDSYSQTNSIKDKQHTLINKYEVLKEKLKEKICFDKANLSTFSSIRASFKHQAILPNIEQASKITTRVSRDFNDTVSKVFKADLNKVSLSILIKDDKLRQQIQAIEEAVASGKANTNTFREAQASVGRIFFDYYEKNGLEGFGLLLKDQRDESAGRKKQRYVFSEKRSDETSLDLLELGMVPYFYHRFKNLIPSFGLDREKNKIIRKDEVVTWGKENWTRLNALYCLNWLIEYALKRQSLYSRKDYVISYQVSRSHIYTPKKTIVLELREIDGNKTMVELKKDLSYLGFLFGFSGGEWQDYEEKENHLVHATLWTTGKRMVGMMPKNEFKIREIHFDELSSDEINQLLLNGENAKQ